MQGIELSMADTQSTNCVKMWR